jgi:hypothetical protein
MQMYENNLLFEMKVNFRHFVKVFMINNFCLSLSVK